MQRLFLILTFLFVAKYAEAQYYIRGEVLGPDNEPVQNVKIYMPSTRGIYYTGSSGGFGIPSSNKSDSLILSRDGFDSLKVLINTEEYQKLYLQKIAGSINLQAQKLVSRTEGKEGFVYPRAYYMDESYNSLVENEFVKADSNLATTFSLRIDKASYSNIRRFINQNTKVPPDAVRIDEMLNYFNFNYEKPAGTDVFHVSSQVTDCPWNAENLLFFLNSSAKKLELDKVPPSNLVFLIDVSGSMDMPKRLPLLKEAFQLMIRNLRAQDTVSIVVYGGSVGIWLTPTGGNEKEKISRSIEQLHASGDTPGEAAIRTAYRLAKSTFIKGGNNRIILATDGDFNVGQSGEKELEQLIAMESERGIYLTCLGVGMGNYKDSKIEVLSKKGNGNFAYLDDIREAEKVLVTEFTQTVFSVASNVSNRIVFNPALVKEYRLIGFDNKKTLLDNKVSELEGGEIGSGAGNTIVFEIVPRDKNYLVQKDDVFARMTIKYFTPGAQIQQSLDYTLRNNYLAFAEIKKDLQFATAVTMYGLQLRGNPNYPRGTWDQVTEIAKTAADPSKYLQEQFVELLQKSKAIYSDKRKRNKKRN